MIKQHCHSLPYLKLLRTRSKSLSTKGRLVSSFVMTLVVSTSTSPQWFCKKENAK